MKRYFFLLVAFLCLSGCAGRTGESYVGTLPDSSAASRIAEDAVSRLASFYPPGHTSLQLMAPAQGDAFSTNFERGLRAKGFTLSPTGTVKVSWVLDELKPEKSWYLRLRIKDGAVTRTLSRAYNAQGMPSAGFAFETTGIKPQGPPLTGSDRARN